MFNKIDPYLQQLVSTASANKKEIDCLVYTNNINFLRKYFKYNNLCSVVASYPFISAVGIKTNNENLFKVAKLNIVTYITASTKVSCLIDNSKKTLNLPNKMSTNGNFTCAVIDTGVSPTLDLCVPENRIVYFKDFINNKTVPYDDNGHGTHCAGIAAGDGRSSGGRYVGIAPEANIVGVKVLDRYNTGYDSNIIKGIQWAVDNKDRYGIDVLNLSLGHEIEESRFFDPLTRAVQKAVRKGLSVVVSAGNSGPAPGTVQSPGNAPKAITVAALNDNGTADRDDDFPASFSSCGPTKIDKLDKPDIAAPGVDIVSCAHDSANYVAMSGTSMAAPFTAGVVALLKEVQADLKPKEIKEAIMESAYQMPWQFQPHSLGAGVIDPPKAMEYIMRN